MSVKYDAEELFVLCRYAKFVELIEPFIQYETFGDELHHIVVIPERKLALKKDEHTYTLLPEEKTVLGYSPESSYHTTSTNSGTLYSAHINGLFNSGIPEFIDRAEKRFKEDMHNYGYPMSFKDYMKRILGINVEKITIRQAQILMKLASTLERKGVVLSDQEFKAKEQLDTVVYLKKKKNN